ncbi:hypothetical protein H4K35_03575 [Myroides sp. NP-2]|uniref:type VI secretion system TssO n=1 Tax=Myroides sp. NP-2 TaxID=2759945 RepID=UPI0015FB9E95|nr:type VI secretion system TssO [Myroides sp. NP-2]MBB1149219.1 hypothetical protein [Myroides sp. NP-2]
MPQYQTKTLAQKEHTYQFLYLLFLLLLTQLILGLIFLSSYQSPFSTIALMDAELLEQKNLFNAKQKEVEPFVVETFQKISELKENMPQPQVENDLLRRMETMAHFFNHSNSYDPRKEGYRQIGDFYQMYFEDKKIQARKSENIQHFRKEFEECSIGFKDKEQQLIQRKNIQMSR